MYGVFACMQAYMRGVYGVCVCVVRALVCVWCV